MQPSHRIETIDLLGIPFARLTPSAAVDEAEDLFDRDDPAWIAVENAHAVNLAMEDQGHLEVLRAADLVLNDGKGMLLGARLLGSSFPADLNGNFFTPLLLDRAAQRGWPTFLLGAAPGVIERAAEVLAVRHPGLAIVGTHHGFMSPDEDAAVCARIRLSGAELLLVGLGMPRQEHWTYKNLAATGARLASTVGAFYDFQTGQVPRAPAWLNRVGLEWIHRLAMEPRRLWRRYLVGNPVFVARVLRQRFARAQR
ncbi:MAG TPA: WecB/TagA/CpsF family glycosyltransferase [Actinomycetota bacterium]|nr:WecB/TagA/CpsF family glycosyltransferase [Actinomycetota bacterium]